jgi:hypothetical protein
VDSNFWFRVRGKSGLGMPSSNTTLPSSPMARRAALIRLRNCRFRDDPPAPDRRKQIVLADDSIPIADQERQQIEYLRLDDLLPRRLGLLAVFEAHCQQGRHAQVPL